MTLSRYLRNTANVRPTTDSDDIFQPDARWPGSGSEKGLSSRPVPCPTWPGCRGSILEEVAEKLPMRNCPDPAFPGTRFEMRADGSVHPDPVVLAGRPVRQAERL